MLKRNVAGWVVGGLLVSSTLAAAGVPAVAVVAAAAVAPGVVFVDQMDDLANWKCDQSTTMSVVRTERKTGDRSLFVRYVIDKDNPGTIWFARTDVGIDRPPAAIQLWVNIPQGQRFSWYDFPKLRIILQDKDKTAVYADIDRFAARPVYEGGKSYYIPWAQVVLDKKLFFPLWPGGNGTLDGIDTVSFELPHRSEDFMKDGEYTLYLDELAVVFEHADAAIKAGIEELGQRNQGHQRELAVLPPGTWQRYPLAVMGVIDLFCANALEELKEGKVVRAARQLEYLQQQSALVGRNLALVKRGKNPYPSVAPARYTHLQVKDGSYFDGDRPVFITGFCGAVGGDQIQRYKQMGFNGFSGGMWMGATVPDGQTVTPPAGTVAEAKFAADHNLAYDVLLGLHAPPGWVYEKWPELDPSCRRRGAAPDAPLSPKNQYMPWNVDHPGFRKLIAEHLKASALALKDIPSLASYDLCNEMWYLCHGDFSPDAFRARLGQRYGTIAALNQAWGTEFKDFQSVQYLAASPVSVADLYEYNQYRVTEFFRFCTAELQKYDAKTPVCGKIHGCWRQMVGIDKVALSKFFTATDSDVYPRIGNDEDSLVADIWTSSMITQEYRSLAPGKPQIDAEQHMIWYHQIVTYDFIRSLLWWRAILGLDANYAWVWNRNCENAEECIFTQPWAFNAFSEFALDIERLSPLVHGFQTVTPDVLLIEAGAKTPDAYKLCAYAGHAFDLLPPAALDEAGMGKYKTIILPDGARLPGNVSGLLDQAERAGCRIIRLDGKLRLSELAGAIQSTAVKSPVQPQSGLVNITVADKNGMPRVFLLNLNPASLSVAVAMPGAATAADLITGCDVPAAGLVLPPLRPVVIGVRQSAP